MRLKILRLLLAAAACSGLPQCFAQASPQITKPVDPSSRHVLTNSIPTQVQFSQDLGRVPSSLQMKDMFLRLKPSATQQAALDQFIQDVQNPHSSNYHHWLQPAEFGSRFGVSDADINTITAWLQSNGLKVSEVARGKGWIRFSGTASQVENAFSTQIHSYSTASAAHYSNATKLSIPNALSPAVSGVLSLNNFIKRSEHTNVATVTRGANGKLVRAATSANTNAPSDSANPEDAALAAHPAFTSQGAVEQTLIAPGDFAKIYNTAPLLSAGTDGSGVSIAIVGRSDISLSDVESFRTIFNLPFNDPTIIHANDDPGVVSGDDEEAILDLEWSGAVAPKANIKYVIGASTTSTDGVDIAAAYIVDNVVAPVMSVSFSGCEQAISEAELQFYHDLWEQAVAEGISVFVAAGDAGSSACDVPYAYIASPYGLGVNGLASTPFNVAVGGTEFADTDLNTYWNPTVGRDFSSAKGYIPEAVWNESCNPNLPAGPQNCYFDPNAEGTYAGGGGASNCAVHSDSASLLTGLYTCESGYPKPAWQTGNGVPQDGVRDIPDVSLAAAAIHDGYLLCYNGSCQWTKNSDGSITLQQASIIGGTSAASPSMAGIMALVEQKNGAFQGLPNYQLYQLAAQQSGSSCDSSAQTDPSQPTSCVFHDVTSGSNALSCVTGRTDCTVAIPGQSSYSLLAGYSAAAGYDAASGLGSVDAANLVAAWGTIKTTPTKTTLAVSSTTFAHGTPVNVTTQVAPASGSGTPSGEITLKAAGTGVTTSPIIASSLTGGQYTASLSNLPGGTYNLTAAYGGDASFSGSTSAPVSLTVSPEASTLTASTLAPSRFAILGKHPLVPATSASLGTTFYIQMQVAGASGAGIATGSIAISDGTKTFGTFPLDRNGSIYIPCGPGTVCDYPLGSYTFTATYSGDSSFNASTGTFPFTINQGTLNYSVNVSSQTPPANSTVIGTVYFGYDPAVLPTGSVTLQRQDTGDTLATGKIGSDGTAVLPFVAPAGTYFVTATYAGDQNYKAGIAVSYPEIITTGGGITTTTTMTASAATATLGSQTAFSISVQPKQSGGSIPTGSITLHTSTGLQAQPVNLVAGHVITNVPWSTAGTTTIYATYNGDANFATSSSALATVTVSKATPTLQLQSMSGYVGVGAQTSIAALLTSPLANTQAAAPTGMVQFFDSVNGGTAQAIGSPQPVNTGNGGAILATLAPVLAQGTHIISAQYSGDANWMAATSAPITVQVTTPDYIPSATPTSLAITAGQVATLTINNQSILGFDSAITAACGGTLPEGITCSSATVQPGVAGAISITSTAPGTTTATAMNHSMTWTAIPEAISVAGLFLLFLPRRRKWFSTLLVIVCAGTVGAFVGCGGSSHPVTTSVVLTSSNTKAASGSTITLQAALNSPNATGTMTFYDGTTAIGQAVSVTNGVATLTTTSLPVGTHAITAKYSGDKHDLSSQSSDVIQQTITGQFTLTVNTSGGGMTHVLSVPVTLQ